MKKILVLGIVLTLVLTMLTISVIAHTADDPFVTDLLVDQTTDVGDVSVWNDDNYLYVKFDTTGNWYMIETNLYIDTSPPSAPISYDYSTPHADVQTYTYSIPLTWDVGVELYIAAHALVYNTGIIGPELVVNGGFETPVVTNPAKWDIFPSGTPGLGWTVAWWGGSTSYGGYTRPSPALKELHRGVNGWLSYSGSQHAELDSDWGGPNAPPNNEPASVRIYQDLTTSNSLYELKYAWSPRPGHNNNQMIVKWGGTQIASHSASGSSNTQWTLQTFSLQGSAGTTRLEFIETGTADSMGMFLDGVSVIGRVEEHAWGGDCQVNGGMYFKYTVQKTWNVEISAEVKDATAVIIGAGGSNLPGQCINCDTCADGSCASTVSYLLSSSAGIVSGTGNSWIYGSGGQGVGRMYTAVDASGDLLFANQDLEAEICQDCADPFDHYTASSSVKVEDGWMFTFLGQGTGVTGPYTGYYPTTGQTLYTTGSAKGEFDAHLTATKDGATRTMGAYGENINFNIGLAFQGMEHDNSKTYGYFNGNMNYGPWQGING